MKHLIILALLSTLFGCAIPQYKKDIQQNDKFLYLEMDMSKKQVIDIMGKPALNEAYKSLKGKSVAIFFYYTHVVWHDGTVTKNETIPVVFENGKLVGWGDEFYNRAQKKIEMDIKVR